MENETTAVAPLTAGGIALRLSMFLLLAALGYVIVPVPFLLIGELPAATMGIFLNGVIANSIVIRIWEAGKLSDVGLDWRESSLRQALHGTALGLLAAAAVVVIPFALGLAHYEPAPGTAHPWASAIFVTILLLFGAMGEELLFRGYGMQLLARFSPWPAILLFGSIFGLVHVINPNASAIGIANTAGFGWLFGYAWLRTRALWLPIGLHFGWNAILPILGVKLSGSTMGVTGYALVWTTGDLWSGGAYGPEAGIPATMVLGVLFWIVSRYRGE